MRQWATLYGTSPSNYARNAHRRIAARRKRIVDELTEARKRRQAAVMWQCAGRLGSKRGTGARKRDSSTVAIMPEVSGIAYYLALPGKVGGACAELAMRPVDGTLPTDFAVPAVFQLHQAPLAPHLYNLAVAPQFRRQKMASRLISTAERVVRLEWRQKELYLHVDVKNNPGAAALYREQAFDPLPDFDNLADVRLGERQTTALHRYHRKRLALPDGAVGTVHSNNALSRHRNTSMV